MYRLLTKEERVRFLREAGDVQRLHVIRTIGEYSNAQHSLNMLAILRLLWPDAPIQLLWAIIEHDIPERLIGDIPSPSIHYGGFIEPWSMMEMQQKILGELFGEFHHTKLDDLLQSWLKGLDLLELYLYAKDQLRLGNRNLETMRVFIEERFKHKASLYPEPILNLFYDCKNSEWAHLPDLGA